MAKAKKMKKKIFGGVSDCKGMGTGGDMRGEVPEGTETRVPHYHESEQDNPKIVKVNEATVTEKELSSHF